MVELGTQVEPSVRLLAAAAQAIEDIAAFPGVDILSTTQGD